MTGLEIVLGAYGVVVTGWAIYTARELGETQAKLEEAVEGWTHAIAGWGDTIRKLRQASEAIKVLQGRRDDLASLPTLTGRGGDA
jgi:hypothetical protein